MRERKMTIAPKESTPIFKSSIFVQDKPEPNSSIRPRRPEIHKNKQIEGLFLLELTIYAQTLELP